MTSHFRPHRFAVLISLGICFALGAARAENLKLPSVFSDHMVLQQQMPLPIWGTADPNSEVTVQFGEQKATTKADASGAWSLELSPEPASGSPRELVIRAGSETLAINDVLVGEVWFCSGQSNMQWAVSRTIDGDLERMLKKSQIRLLKAQRFQSAEPVADNGGTWSLPTPEAISGFSSVGWHFGRTLETVLDVPVGLIDSSWGGTPMIAWTRPDAMSDHPQLQERWNEWIEKMPSFPEMLKKWEADLAAWQKENNVAPEDFNPRKHRSAPGKPTFDPESSHRPGSLANGMVTPFMPFALRGVIWYQGESDAGFEPLDYGDRIAAMFADWREAWGLPKMYVGIVQLANYMEPKTDPSDDPWPKLREGQRQFDLEFPESGMAVAIDVGEANDIHPQDKFTVGRRLARLALADVYGIEVLRGGPELEKAEFQDGSVLLTFRQTGTKLISRNRNDLGGFTLAGNDGTFHNAQAEILSETQVKVWSDAVPEPTHLRYAWQSNPVDASLFNFERLPATPFEIKK